MTSQMPGGKGLCNDFAQRDRAKPIFQHMVFPVGCAGKIGFPARGFGAAEGRRGEAPSFFLFLYFFFVFFLFFLYK